MKYLVIAIALVIGLIVGICIKSDTPDLPHISIESTEEMEKVSLDDFYLFLEEEDTIRKFRVKGNYELIDFYPKFTLH